jgi:hypothetical protein
MPTISRFYGIVIQMFFRDHSPPHFHAVYQEHDLMIGISPIRLLQGDAPARVKSMVLEWAALHQQELIDDWQRASTLQPPLPIAPLD